jgi:glycosyltransferase involved in cell wall biosynthesis
MGEIDSQRAAARERLRIVHVAAVAPFGGLESMVALLAAGQVRRGHDVRVAAVLDLEPDPHPFETALAQAGVASAPIRLAHRAYRAERRALAERFVAARAQVVHTHGYRADVQAGAVARRLAIPTLSTTHGFTGGDWKNRLFEWLQVRSLRRAGAVVAVSRPQVERLRAGGVAADRIHLLPNAWGGKGGAHPRGEARRELGIPAGCFAVGWVGRLSFEKGADVLLDALARTRDPALVACLVGDGAERARLVARARELGVHERVHWAGARPDAGRLFAAFDGFALSSRTEGTPMVLFEAIDAGVPVVATAVGGVPDVVGPDEAWLVPPEDPAALARALDELRGDPGGAARRVSAARARLAERYGLEPWLDAYERIYRSIVR